MVQPDLERKSCNKGGYASLRNYRKQVTDYFAYYWNWIDFFMLSLFLLGELCRLIPNGQDARRIILAFSLFVFYIRFLHNLTAFENIGPKVFMIFKMVSYELYVIHVVIQYK